MLGMHYLKKEQQAGLGWDGVGATQTWKLLEQLCPSIYPRLLWLGNSFVALSIKALKKKHWGRHLAQQ